MTPETNFNEPALEQAMAEIRDDAVDPAVVEAAAARVWARLAQAAQAGPVEHIRSCGDFQALIPEYRAGRLTDARAMLIKDHLHECVACRRVYEGRVTEITNDYVCLSETPGEPFGADSADSQPVFIFFEAIESVAATVPNE